MVDTIAQLLGMTRFQLQFTVYGLLSIAGIVVIVVAVYIALFGYQKDKK
jgi:hypothetical protein